MFLKIYGLTSTLTAKALVFLGGIVLVMTFVDYFTKWQLYSVLSGMILVIFRFLHQFFVPLTVVIYLFTLTYFLWRLNRKFQNSKESFLEKEILDTKSSIETMVKNLEVQWVAKINSLDKRVDGRIFEIERTLVDFEIEQHRSKNQVGELAMMIKKLGMDIKMGWGGR